MERTGDATTTKFAGTNYDVLFAIILFAVAILTFLFVRLHLSRRSAENQEIVTPIIITVPGAPIKSKSNKIPIEMNKRFRQPNLGKILEVYDILTTTTNRKKYLVRYKRNKHLMIEKQRFEPTLPNITEEEEVSANELTSEGNMYDISTTSTRFSPPSFAINPLKRKASSDASASRPFKRPRTSESTPGSPSTEPTVTTTNSAPAVPATISESTETAVNYLRTVPRRERSQCCTTVQRKEKRRPKCKRKRKYLSIDPTKLTKPYPKGKGEYFVLVQLRLVILKEEFRLRKPDLQTIPEPPVSILPFLSLDTIVEGQEEEVSTNELTSEGNVHDLSTTSTRSSPRSFVRELRISKTGCLFDPCPAPRKAPQETRNLVDESELVARRLDFAMDEGEEEDPISFHCGMDLEEDAPNAPFIESAPGPVESMRPASTRTRTVSDGGLRRSARLAHKGLGSNFTPFGRRFSMRLASKKT